MIEHLPEREGLRISTQAAQRLGEPYDARNHATTSAANSALVARAKRRVGRKLNSSSTVSEASQNMICAYLSIALLVGLLANALAGWWWADPVAALVIAAEPREKVPTPGKARAATAARNRRSRPRARPSWHCYLKMFTALAATSSTVTAESPDSVSIRNFAQRLSGIASVGLKAIELVKEM